MAPAISSTPRNRIDETLELETHQTSFATYFTQPLKPVQAKQSVPGTSGYTSAAASSKPYAPAAPKNTVMPPTSTVKPNIQKQQRQPGEAQSGNFCWHCHWHHFSRSLCGIGRLLDFFPVQKVRKELQEHQEWHMDGKPNSFIQRRIPAEGDAVQEE
ncbi:hypothetical protein MGG_08218 [Pyricularia oryzae 70-15]|uniref:Uncharacterized protein n=1 Tax=Pyricularia oryzae (strain 70-15 / ATCC MYA-4617 / FGSC 8958) TaxID=242507 RepID=G4MXX1_PYRO7|nr:uncharacterized protein MGG_08218 [Pyricularia oryzae 70-15]EHA56061.1 hypothetical protein MGG_08218 [Pyricularia oryzae 70-15]